MERLKTFSVFSTTLYIHIFRVFTIVSTLLFLFVYIIDVCFFQIYSKTCGLTFVLARTVLFMLIHLSSNYTEYHTLSCLVCRGHFNGYPLWSRWVVAYPSIYFTSLNTRRYMYIRYSTSKWKSHTRRQYDINVSSTIKESLKIIVVRCFLFIMHHNLMTVLGSILWVAIVKLLSRLLNWDNLLRTIYLLSLPLS